MVSFGNGSFPGQEWKQQARTQEECLESRQERNQEPEGDLPFHVKGWTEARLTSAHFYSPGNLKKRHNLLLLASEVVWLAGWVCSVCL